MLWTEVLSNRPTCKLIAYAQRWCLKDEWMDTQELAEATDLSANAVYEHIDGPRMLGVYEHTTKGRKAVYRPNEDSYVLQVFEDIEDTLRTNLENEGENTYN